ncbi:hypothetical protein E2C01_033382 [Portunus trituberculatus]|uniref:Uncharacterized protein n=1 Tax=Portunus trituberculatus TaxID=210409 RepID=A0A5B7F423_PORTR|nr:hypothetical protein [Portunus trituberculatus]
MLARQLGGVWSTLPSRVYVSLTQGAVHPAGADEIDVPLRYNTFIPPAHLRLTSRCWITRGDVISHRGSPTVTYHGGLTLERGAVFGHRSRPSWQYSGSAHLPRHPQTHASPHSFTLPPPDTR